MKTRCFVPLLSFGVMLLCGIDANAHGGMYRGPSDVVPPTPGRTGGGGPPGPATPGPTTPSAPHPSGPMTPAPAPATTGGPRPPAGAPAGRTTGGTPITLDPDLSSWDFWWEFNKDAYLHLKDAVHTSGPTTGTEDIWMGQGTGMHREETLRPTRAQLQNEVLPAMKRAIDATDDKDITTSCMVAMAKIGVDHPEFALLDVFRARLKRNEQEVRETAALAIGIAGRNSHGELELLQGLAADDAEGRRAAGGAVDTRTRAFALYGLGLLAHEHSDLAVKRAAFATARAVLADDRASERNLKVAAITAIGMLDIGGATPGDRSLRDEAIACLEGYYTRDLGSGEQLIQAHCPIAVARLAGRSGPAADEIKRRCADDLKRDDRKRRSADLDRSCVLALGQLCGPWDDDKSPDAELSKLLWEVRAKNRDKQTGYFATIALGQIGGKQNRERLVDGLRRGKALEQPWFAIALGVMTHAQYTAQTNAGRDLEIDEDVAAALADQWRDGSEPSFTGALGIAYGLCRCTDMAPKLRERLVKEPHKEAQAGYLALGLALMNDRAAIETLRNVLPLATRRPDLLKQAAVALGLLGDKSAESALRTLLVDANGNLATFAAAASALGLIGDRRSIEPLSKLLFDTSRSDLTRAFAAVALGGIADRASLPWYTKIAANLNYRASVETLTNQNTGILDIL